MLSYDEKVKYAEDASEELRVREGRAELPDDQRPLRELDNEELEQMATWDPEVDPDVIEDKGNGITLRRTKRRSSASRRIKGEPEPESIDDALEADRQQKVEQPKPPAKPPRAPKSPAKPPSRTRARVPLGSGISTLMATVGTGLVVTGRDPGVGAALQFESPIAGEKIDAMIAGTIIDKFAQPLARVGSTGKDLGSILGLPILVGLCERRPGLLALPMVRQIGQAMIVDLAVKLVQSSEAAQQRIEEATKLDPKVAQLAEQMMGMFFGPEGGAPSDPSHPAGD